MSNKERVGFIGLGAMGVGMAANVVSKGYPLTVLGRTRREPVERLLAMGATEVRTPAELRPRCDIIILCVTTSEAVEEIVLGDNGLLSSGDNPFLLIDCGTSRPDSTVALGARLAESACSMMDVPLGRSAAAAESGTLNMMAGGSIEDFNRARPLLETMSENLFHVGELGVGHRIKLINNGYSMAVACLAAESMATARAGGVDLKVVNQVMSAGPNRSDFFDWMMASAIEGDETKLEFALKNGLKDMGYFNAMAEEVGVDATLPMAAHARLKALVEAGHGDEYVPALMRLIQA
ncbi:MAG: NAD(P)-dependent oxidoreductase [Granulosicoccus sp.]|nr:NAD(P)-dependent oxidoreductase [Granulosicoccus sp.]